MGRGRRSFRAGLVAGLLACSLLSAGCPLGDNLTINYVIPLGFGGAPGLYNPYGIVQALVNALLGVGATGGGTTTPGSAPSPAPVNPGIIPVITNP